MNGTHPRRLTVHSSQFTIPACATRLIGGQDMKERMCPPRRVRAVSCIRRTLAMLVMAMIWRWRWRWRWWAGSTSLKPNFRLAELRRLDEDLPPKAGSRQAAPPRRLFSWPDSVWEKVAARHVGSSGMPACIPIRSTMKERKMEAGAHSGYEPHTTCFSTTR
jgi:hypothetical protein